MCTALPVGKKAFEASVSAVHYSQGLFRRRPDAVYRFVRRGALTLMTALNNNPALSDVTLEQFNISTSSV